MNEKQRAAFESVFGEALTSQMVSEGETKTAELEATGVAYKEMQEEPVEEVVEEAVEEEKATEEEVEEVVEEVEEEEKEVEEYEEVVEETEEESKEIPLTREEVTEGFKTLIDELSEKFEAMVDTKVSAAIDELIEVVVPLAKQVKELSESDEQKIAAKVQDTPSASLSSMITQSIIGAKETHVDGRTTFAKDGPEEEEKSVVGPKVGGTTLKLWN